MGRHLVSFTNTSTLGKEVILSQDSSVTKKKQLQINLHKDRILVAQRTPEHDHLAEPISSGVLAIKTTTMTTKREIVNEIRGGRTGWRPSVKKC